MSQHTTRRWVVSVMLITGLPAVATTQGPEGVADPSPPPPELLLRSDGTATALSLGAAQPFHRTMRPVVDERLVAVPGSPVRLVLWREVEPTGEAIPYYAISFDGRQMATVRPTSYVLKLGYADFDPLENLPAVPAGLAAAENTGMFIVQFVTQPLEEFRAAITAAGGTVHKFLANHAHFVSMSPEVRGAVAEFPFVRWIGPVHPVYKLEPPILDQMLSGVEVEPRRYSIMLPERGVAAQDRVVAVIEQFGGQVHGTTPQGFRIEATLSLTQVQEVAALDDVLFIDRKGPLEPDMDLAREISGANYIESVAGFTGQGVRGEVADTELNTTHVEWSAPPIIHRPGSGLAHGTSVYGILFARGANPQARGLIPDGVGIFAASDGLLGGGPTRYDHTAELVDPDGAYRTVFQTNSTGDPRTLSYTTISAEMDDLLFIYDILLCQSQSNAGDQFSRPQAWAKNIVSGGGVRHYDTLDKDDDCWCGGASIGPASDGRIKPDLSHFYDSTFTAESGGGYTQFGGTSGATPILCGHFGLFFQMWSAGIFGNEVDPDGTVFENRPHMTTAKAMMINTATQYPFTGSSHDLTRVHQGWGMPDLQNLYDLREHISIIDETELLANLESQEFVAFVEPGEPAVRATLVYADPPGVPMSSQHRINDLTLKMTSPSGTVYWGNQGLLAANWSAPGGGANTLDTVENIFVQNPESGVWDLEVIASEINEDGHVETPELDADFALVVSGALLSSCTFDGRMALDRENYGCSSPVEIHLADCHLNTDDSVIDTIMVTVASTTEPAGETVLLTETDGQTANFIGTLLLSGVDAPGVLQVGEGDLITATYIDADDGLGGTDVVVTAEATVIDCTPPLLSNVQVDQIEPHSARVTFETDEPAIGVVRFGTSCEALTDSVADLEPATAHALVLTGLPDGTPHFFTVEAVDEWDNVVIDDAAGECHGFTTMVVFLEDDFETDQGWTVENQGLFAGAWQRGVPVNCNRGDPPTDFDGSGRCYVTDNSAVSCNSDVDGGPTRLISPLFDLSTATDPVVRYARWFKNDDLDQDRLEVEITNDDGASWVLIESVPHTEGWVQRDVRVLDYVTLTSQVRIRFSATDNPNNSVTEAGIDGLRITAFPGMLGDFDLDQDIDLADVSVFQTCFGLSPDGVCGRGNMNGDGILDLDDYNLFVDVITGPQ